MVNHCRKGEEKANVLTTLVEISQSALALTEDQQERLTSYYDDLARCADEIPEQLKSSVQAEIDSMHRASCNLRSAQQRVSAMEDELSARLHDGCKSVNRKWYLPNPPANAAIDFRESEKKHFARGMNLYKMMLILVIGSFLGVVVELLWCLLTNGYLESRSGLVYGPFNLLYGVGALVLSLCLYKYRNRGYLPSFLGGMIVGSAVEYACSLFQELAFGSRSWDYSHMPFHLNGRICLIYSVFWGILGVLWIKDIYPRMAKWILRLPDRAGKILTLALCIFLALDGLVSGAAVLRWSERHRGVPADHGVRQVLDEYFPDERMETIYANMIFN